jgi:hypothetical protein
MKQNILDTVVLFNFAGIKFRANDIIDITTVNVFSKMSKNRFRTRGLKLSK